MNQQKSFLIIVFCWIFIFYSCSDFNNQKKIKQIEQDSILYSNLIANSDFSSLVELDSSQVRQLLEYDEITHWDYINQSQFKVPAIKYGREKPTTKIQYLKEFLEKHRFYWYPYQHNGFRFNLILHTYGNKVEDWQEKPYRLVIYFPNSFNNKLVPVEIGGYDLALLITQYERNSSIYLSTDRKLITESWSSLYSDVGDINIDGVTTVSIKSTFAIDSNRNIKHIQSDTTWTTK